MKKWLILATLTLSIGVVWMIQKEKTEVDARKVPGSRRALTAWVEERAYPSGVIPSTGISQAFRERSFSRPPVKLKMDTVWQSLGYAGAGGRTLSIAVHPQNSQLVWAGSASGGLWKSETGGEGANAWSRVDTGYPILGVAAIAIRPDAPDTMFIGTGEVYGHPSTQPGVADRLTRGGYGVGVLKSSDGGQSWSPALDWQLNQERGVQHLRIDPNRPDHIWASTSEGIYHSTDNGVSWRLSLDVVMATSLEILTDDGMTIVAACGGLESPGHGIYRSTDGGQSWSKMSEGLPATFRGKAILTKSPITPGRIFASIGDGLFVPLQQQSFTQLVRSDDFGQTWQVINSENHYALWQGWYSHYVDVDPINENRLFVGGVQLSRSLDGGRTLNLIQGTGADHHALTRDPNDTRIIYLALDQGIMKSTDNGVTFFDASNGYNTLQFYNGMAQAQDGELFLGCPQDYIAVFKYEGDSWGVDFGVAEGGYLWIPPGSDEDYFYAVPQRGVFGFYRDGVETNKDFPDSRLNLDATSFNAPFSGTAANPEVFYWAGERLYRTDNEGDSWEAVNSGELIDPSPILAMGVSQKDENLVYVASAPRFGPLGIYRTRDGGDTWTNITQGLPERFPKDLIIDPNDDDTIYLVFSGFGSSHVYRSRDAGETWEDIDRGALPDIPTHALAVDPLNSDIIYIGNDLGVYATLDGGKTWFDWSNGMPSAMMVADLHVYSGRRMLRMGSHGYGAWERPMIEADLVVEPLPNRYRITELSGSNQGNHQVVLVNPGDEAVDYQVNIYDDSGEHTIIQPDAPIGALTRVVLNPANWPEDAAWVDVAASSKLRVYAEMRTAETAAAWPATRGDRLTYIPHIARDTNQFETVVSVANVGEAGLNARVKPFPSETSMSVPDLNEGLSQTSADMQSILGDDLTGVDWAWLVGDRAEWAAMEYFTRLPDRLETAAIPLSGESSQTLHFLHIAQDTARFWTGVVYINPNPDAATFQEITYDANGQILQTLELALEPYAKRTLLYDADTLSGGQVPQGAARIMVQSDRELIGYQLFGAPLSSDNQTFAGLAAETGAGSQIDYANVQTGDGLWTGLVAVNLGDSPSDVVFELYDDAGAILEQVTVEGVAPGAKVVQLASELFPQQHLNGRWARAKGGDSQWSGYTLWGDLGTPRRFLAGLEGFVE